MTWFGQSIHVPNELNCLFGDTLLLFACHRTSTRKRLLVLLLLLVWPVGVLRIALKTSDIEITCIATTVCQLRRMALYYMYEEYLDCSSFPAVLVSQSRNNAKKQKAVCFPNNSIMLEITRDRTPQYLQSHYRRRGNWLSM